MSQHTPGPGEETDVQVGWATHPEMGTVLCHVVDRWQSSPNDFNVKSVNWANGKISRVAWCGSQTRYMFLDPHNSVWHGKSRRSRSEINMSQHGHAPRGTYVV